MRILILNWRDIKNPKSGGAEILTHEIAKRWVKSGHVVTQLSSEFANSSKEEIIDGVRIIRKGLPDARFLLSSVHFQAFLTYKREFKGNVDVVIDEVHGIPFFTPFYVSEKRVALICEVAEDIWLKMFGLFYGVMGRLIEIFYLRFIYQGIKILTISQSTKDELIKEGIKEKNINVIPMGVTFPKNLKNFPKENNPTIIYVGRLSKGKGIEDAVISLKKIINVLPNAMLWIVGQGENEYEEKLKKLSKVNELEKNVLFWGFVPERKKFELMQKAHVMVVPSMKEGWGLVVPEAALVGTPSVVYDSPGLRDVLEGKELKIIAGSNNPDSLAQEIIKVIKGEKKYNKLDPKTYSWDKTAENAMRILQKL